MEEDSQVLQLPGLQVRWTEEAEYLLAALNLMYRDLSLEEFYIATFSPPPGTLLTCKLVAERLKEAVKEVACR